MRGQNKLPPILKRVISGRFRVSGVVPGIGVHLCVGLQHSARRASIGLDMPACRRVQ
nr:MAG TPA: hypothetical protein [Caudoviricetes sp.]